MVAIGRMLMSDPEVMLLDEPSVALSPVAVDIVVKALLELRKRGASLLLVEQRVDVAVRVCDRLYIMTPRRDRRRDDARRRPQRRASASSTNIWADAGATELVWNMPKGENCRPVKGSGK